MSKRSMLIALAIAVAVLVLSPTAAFANYAIHGGYTQDTDACAGCHRAHTSASTLTWEDSFGNDHSSLLVSSADSMYKFCYACHDAASQGAETDVQYGVYEGTAHGSNDTTLNGGGFEGMGGTVGGITSTHMYNGASWGAYGGGAFGTGAAGSNGEPINGVQRPGVAMAGVGETDEQIKMDCVSCHDPHGSSNYRILKDQVYGNTVGGYDGSGNPTPFVLSAEPGFPTTATALGYNGFKKQTQYPSYAPNYTVAKYAKGPGGDKSKGMSGWCAGCHATYLQETSVYNANDGHDMATRHRHPMNSELDNFDKSPGRGVIITDQPLPLAHDPAESLTTVNEDGQDWIECLTCHYAHGASSDMTGYANVVDSRNPEPNTGTGGVDPTGDSALLRLNNRGVCQACHNQ